jgi:hypothetical protein
MVHDNHDSRNGTVIITIPKRHPKMAVRHEISMGKASRTTG